MGPHINCEDVQICGTVYAEINYIDNLRYVML